MRSTKSKSILPPFLAEKDHSQLDYTPQSGLKSAAFEIWVFGGLLSYGTMGGVCIYVRDITWILEDLTLFPIWIVTLGGPLLAFFIWLFAKPTVCTFDSKRQTVHYKSHKHDFTLPWRQIRFQARHLPTGKGMVATEFFVLADPPFPEGLFPKDLGKAKKINSEGSLFNLGTFRVDDQEEANRYMEFFHAFMASIGPAEKLYQRIVPSDRKPDSSNPFGKLTIS